MLKSMHIIPGQEFNAILSISIDKEQLQSKVNAVKVFDGNKHDFHIILSSGQDLTRKTVPPRCKHLEILSLLLKGSIVTVVFIYFAPDLACTNSSLGLWAHRCVMSPYAAFHKLISEGEELVNKKKSAQEIDETAGDISAAIALTGGIPILVDKCSLSAFCALLYYIYTGDIDLKLDMTRFLCHRDNGRDNSWSLSSLMVGNEFSTTPDTTWGELMEAADYYGITELGQQCRRGTINGLDKTNVIGVLFGKAGCDP
ncbi:hypothetical protein BGX23_011284 [Mortierella sp. AD031]|nr:hypothetical protein BGX23_011284 [Mortierella sp. AD031]